MLPALSTRVALLEIKNLRDSKSWPCFRPKHANFYTPLVPLSHQNGTKKRYPMGRHIVKGGVDDRKWEL